MQLSCTSISPAILAFLFTHKNRTIIPCVRTAEPPHPAFARESHREPSISPYCIVSGNGKPPSSIMLLKKRFQIRANRRYSVVGFSFLLRT